MEFVLFFGFLFIGTILLYTQTKDRWNWTRICKRTGLILLLLISVPILLSAMVYIWESYEKTQRNKPVVVNGMYGYTLGDKLADVKFKQQITFLPDADNGYATYFDSSNRVFLDFDKKTEKLLRLIATCETRTYGHDVPGTEVSCGSSGELVQERYGLKNVSIYCAREDTDYRGSRLYSVPKYQVSFILESNSVSSIGVSNKEEMGYLSRWLSCDKVSGLDKK